MGTVAQASGISCLVWENASNVPRSRHSYRSREAAWGCRTSMSVAAFEGIADRVAVGQVSGGREERRGRSGEVGGRRGARVCEMFIMRVLRTKYPALSAKYSPRIVNAAALLHSPYLLPLCSYLSSPLPLTPHPARHPRRRRLQRAGALRARGARRARG